MAQDRHPPEKRLSDAFVALATPPGRSALAVLRVGGPGARRIARELLGLQSPEPRRATTRLARHRGAELDRVVAVFWDGRDSPIGEDMLELSCHGSPEIARALTDAALELGARPAEPGEFTRRAYVNGKLDLAQAEAVCALIKASGERQRKAALARLEGGLSRRIAQARGPVLELLARIEARLDHPDEDIAPIGDAAAEIEALKRPLERLLAAYDRGRTEREGLRICLVGKPNAGKSSLLNALLGRDRAIVAPEPGTTRDTIEESACLDGRAAILVDTAGLRPDVADEAERQGISRAERALDDSDVAVLVVDATRVQDGEDARLRERAASGGRRVIVALNKSDLVQDKTALLGGLAVSAKTGEGLDGLARALAGAAVHDEDAGEGLLLGARDRDALAAALSELDAAAEVARTADWEDRAACHLREAHAKLGMILGEGAPDEVLKAVFTRFCVGK